MRSSLDGEKKNPNKIKIPVGYFPYVENSKLTTEGAC